MGYLFIYKYLKKMNKRMKRIESLLNAMITQGPALEALRLQLEAGKSSLKEAITNSNQEK